MAQITGVGFSNFRVFEKNSFFDVAPISIFTGTNSSGKSSVFKGLRIINDNASDLTRLNFSGESHKLGTFKLAKSYNSSTSTIRFVLELNKESLLIIDYSGEENGYWKQLQLTIGTTYKQYYKDDELRLRMTFDRNDFSYDLKDNQELEPYLGVFINGANIYRNILKRIASFDPCKERNPIEEAFSKNTKKLKAWGGRVVSSEKLAIIIPSLNFEEISNLEKELEEIILSR